jgi:hypothetical protein
MRSGAASGRPQSRRDRILCRVRRLVAAPLLTLPAVAQELSVRPALAFAPVRLTVELRAPHRERFALFGASGGVIVCLATGSGPARLCFDVPPRFPGGELLLQALVTDGRRLRTTGIARAVVGRLEVRRRSEPRASQPADVVNVGQRCELEAELHPPALRAIAAFAWTLTGDAVRDYVETTDREFELQPIRPEDLRRSVVTCYWLPARSQIHPKQGPRIPRLARVRVTLPGGAHAVAMLKLLVERNASDPDLQAEDWYVEYNHPEPGHGMPPTRVLNEHAHWHATHDWYLNPPCGPGLPGFRDFLGFHRRFQDRFEEWRALFGYAPLEPWDPATRIPAGPTIDHRQRLTSAPDYPRPTYLTTAGGTLGSPCFQRTKLADFRSDIELSAETFEPWHNGVHVRVGLDMSGHHTSRRTRSSGASTSSSTGRSTNAGCGADDRRRVAAGWSPSRQPGWQRRRGPTRPPARSRRLASFASP